MHIVRRSTIDTHRTIPLGTAHGPTFLVSPAVELLHAIELIVMADGWEGHFAPWVYDARETLATEEFEALAAFNTVIRWERLLSKLADESALPRGFDWLADYLRNLDAGDVMALVSEEFRDLAGRSLIAIENAMLSASKRSGVSVSDPKPIAQRVAELLTKDPAALREAYVDAIEAFFKRSLRSKWERTRPVLEQEVATQVGRVHPAALSTLIEQLTGRSVSLPEDLTSDFEQLFVVPTTLLGPHITLSPLPGDGRKLLLIYGFDAAAKKRAPGEASMPSIHAGFKALGEETRFRIVEILSEGEMYAHEIGLRFPHLGQPAISRHLRHLVSSGILGVRDAHAKKYYSLNRGRMLELEAKLGQLRNLAGSVESASGGTPNE